MELAAAYAAETAGFLPPADLKKVVHDVKLWRSHNAIMGGPLVSNAGTAALMELADFETEEDELELVDAVVMVRACGIRGLPLEAWDVKCLEHVANYHLERLDSVRLALDAQEELSRRALQFLVATALTLEAAATVLNTVGRDLRSAPFGDMVDTLSTNYTAQVERLDWSAGDAFAVVSPTAGATVRRVALAAPVEAPQEEEGVLIRVLRCVGNIAASVAAAMEVAFGAVRRFWGW